MDKGRKKKMKEAHQVEGLSRRDVESAATRVVRGEQGINGIEYRDGMETCMTSWGFSKRAAAMTGTNAKQTPPNARGTQSREEEHG